MRICKEQREQAAACPLQDSRLQAVRASLTPPVLDSPVRLPALRSLEVCLRQEPDPGMYSFPCLANFRMHVIQGGEIKAFLWT